MKVEWEQRRSSWKSILAAAFGLVCAAVAVYEWDRITIPGVFVGSIWFIAGWKGSPLVSTLPIDSKRTPADIELGASVIRRRRLIALFSPITPFLLSPILISAPREYEPIALLVCGMPMFAFFAIWMFSQCPNCGKHFYPLAGWTTMISLHRCHNCGLDIKKQSE